MKQQRHPPITLICDGCGNEFKRAYGYQKFLVERRGITKFFCTRACKQTSQIFVLPDDIEERYKNGETLDAIGASLGVTDGAIRNALLRKGVKMRSRAWHISTDRNPTKGKGHSDAAKQKMRDANARQFSDPEARSRHAELTAQQIADGRTGKSFNKLETKVAAKYTEQNIAFQWQFRLGRFTYDFYLPDTNTLVEVHGTFWHADPRFYSNKPLHPIQIRNTANDLKKAAFAQERGYNFAVIWEHDVYQLVGHSSSSRGKFK